ncbi:MAG: ATP-grasp domain-containing protein [Methanothrix sp.]|nr:ATP-grasp domain-containing protein [Methanothrix sp.]
MRILVIGINIRHIAASASRAGHEVMAVDCYCDVDLARYAKETAKMPREVASEHLSFYVDKFCPDAVVLGPGLEDASIRGAVVLNNSPEKTAKVSDKLWLAGWLEENGFPFIKTERLDSLDNPRYPFLVKPRKGAGGVGCRTVESAAQLQLHEEDLIAQELINGRPASVSVIGNGSQARAIAVNEQLIGVPWAGAKGFRYSGNITPLASPQCAIAEMAEEIISKLGLLGSNGVDFLLTEKGPVVVEVNSRFQGSLDTVELSGGENVFQAHLQSFGGRLPKRPGPASCTAGRIIVYAPCDLIIEADLVREWTADVPVTGSRIAADDPILSILAQGSSRDDVIAQLKMRVAMLGNLIKNKTIYYQDTTL